MKTFNVTVIRDSDQETFTADVQAKDEWQARTLIFFKTPRNWANGSGVTYQIKEII